MRNESSIIAKHIAAFLNDYAPNQRMCSPHTLKSYQDALSLYLIFLAQKGIQCKNLSGQCFATQMIEDWLRWLRDTRNNQAETCNNRLAALRTFLSYLASKEICYIGINHEAALIHRLPVCRKAVEGLSRSAVQALLAMPDQASHIGKRDLMLMLMLYSTAARIDEILSMKVNQLHLEASRPYAIVLGKGNKIRTLYLLPRTVSHLKKYLTEFHGNHPNPEAYVFYSRNVGVFGKLTAAAVDKMLKKYARLAHASCEEVPLTLHAHQFRHAKASHWLEDGMNIVQISFLLGHKQIETTMIYLDITQEDEVKALATIESESDSKVNKKWRNPDGSLLEFCGISKK